MNINDIIKIVIFWGIVYAIGFYATYGTPAWEAAAYDSSPEIQMFNFN